MTIRSWANIHEDRHCVDAEICVVGAGFAGLLAARRLAGAGRRVVLIESGDAQCSGAIQHLNEIEDVFGRFKGATTGRFRGFGGTSSRWTGGMLPLTENDIAARSYAGLPGWPIGADALDKYRHEIEDAFGVGHASYEADLFQDAAYDVAPDDDFVPRWMKWPRFERCHLGAILRAEVADCPRLDVWLDATVCDFRLDETLGRIVAIEAKGEAGRVLEISADEFVFAAGTIETTRLVLLLDRVSRGHAYARCKVLGRYFQDHMRAQVGHLEMRDRREASLYLATRFIGSIRRSLHLELSPEAQAKAGVPSAFAQIGTRLMEGSALRTIKELGRAIQLRDVKLQFGQIQALASSPAILTRLAWWRYVHRRLELWEDAEIAVEICAEQIPAWSSRISLSDQRDAFGVPRVKLEWCPSREDEKTFRVVVERLDGYWRRSGFDRMCPIEWTAQAEGEGSIAETAVDMYHPSGSTRMGVDPAQSVVDGDLRCHHVANLTLASASVFPTAGSANPTFTIMQTALYAADRLLDRSRTRSSGESRPKVPFDRTRSIQLCDGMPGGPFPHAPGPADIRIEDAEPPMMRSPASSSHTVERP